MSELHSSSCLGVRLAMCEFESAVCECERDCVWMRMWMCAQERRGYTFESETDTEVIPKLAAYIYATLRRNGMQPSFREIVEHVIVELVRAFSPAAASSSCLMPSAFCLLPPPTTTPDTCFTLIPFHSIFRFDSATPRHMHYKQSTLLFSIAVYRNIYRNRCTVLYFTCTRALL